jgi:hypothetical protein
MRPTEIERKLGTRMSLADLVFESFEPHVGEDFVLPGADGTPPLHFTLTEAKKLAPAPRPEFRDPFQLVFRVASPDVYNQGMYRLTHATVGEHDIFLVPMAQSDAGVDYCASFN